MFVRQHVTISEKRLQQLKEEARKKELNLSELIRRIIDDYLDSKRSK